jgi:hypothetical protein
LQPSAHETDGGDDVRGNTEETSLIGRRVVLAAQTIEVTQVTIVKGGSASPRKRMIATEDIVSIATGSENMSTILLGGGELVNVQETYEQLKKLTGVVNDASRS